VLKLSSVSELEYIARTDPKDKVTQCVYNAKDYDWSQVKYTTVIRVNMPGNRSTETRINLGNVERKRSVSENNHSGADSTGITGKFSANNNNN